MGKTRCFQTPQAAEKAFYSAFECADLEAMMRVWAEDDSIICIHPAEPRLCGRREIRAGWEQIFASGVRLKFTLKHNHRTCDASLSIHMFRECLPVGGVSQGAVLTTNVYQLIDGDWRMKLHASPDPVSYVEVSEAEALH